jgi:hypothetical protein
VKDETNGTTIYPLVYHPLARSLALPRKKISKSGE